MGKKPVFLFTLKKEQKPDSFKTKKTVFFFKTKTGGLFFLKKKRVFLNPAANSIFLGGATVVNFNLPAQN